MLRILRHRCSRIASRHRQVCILNWVRLLCSGVMAFRAAAERFRAEGRVVFCPLGVFASWIDGFAPSGVTMTGGGWGSRRIGTHSVDATLCARSAGEVGVLRFVAGDCGPSVCSDPLRSTPPKRALGPREEPHPTEFAGSRAPSSWSTFRLDLRGSSSERHSGRSGRRCHRPMPITPAAASAANSDPSRPRSVSTSIVCAPSSGAGPRGPTSAPRMNMGAATVRNRPFGCSM